MPAPKYPAIPDPTTDPQSLRDSVLALKQMVELLAGTRGDAAAASASDLATTSDTVASQGDSITALQSALAGLSYVSSIAGNTGAFTLNNTSGLENSGNTLQLRQGSPSQFGAVKVDNVTLQAVAGVISTLNPILTSSSAALGADVALSNTGLYFDGPSVSLAAGVWFVTATVTVLDTGTTAAIYAKLWNGTTVYASASGYSGNVARGTPITLSAIVSIGSTQTIKVSCRDVDASTGKILFNQSGNSKDSHITALRIG